MFIMDFIRLSWDEPNSQRILNNQKLFIVKDGKISLVLEITCFKILYIVYS